MTPGKQTIGVIGGGLGGLGGGVHAGRRRPRVILFERRTTGSAARPPCWKQEGFRFDMGPDHPDLARACCERIFAEAGRSHARWRSTWCGSIRNGAASSTMDRVLDLGEDVPR